MQATELVGKVYEPFTFEVEKGRIAFFAKAIGETDPVYFDEAAAKAAGYRAIPAPPTFGFTTTMDSEQSFQILADLGVDRTRTVHGEQAFTYHAGIFAGDVVTGRQRVVEA